MKTRSIRFNFLMNAATMAVNFLFPLITFPYVSHVLDPAGYGAAEFALSSAQLFSLVALLGINTYGVRECARVRGDEAALMTVLQELLIIVGLWTIVVTLAFYSSIALVPRFRASSSLFCIAGALIPLTTIGLQWFMSACEQYAFMAVRNLIVKLVVVAAMFLLVRTNRDVVVWIAISVLSTGLASAANVAFVCKHVKLHKLSGLNLRRHLKPLLVFFFMVASISVYTTVDAVMLGSITCDADVGYYNVAVKIKNVFTAIIAALAGVLVPRATFFLAQGNKLAYERVVNLSVRAALIYSFFAVVAGIVFSDSIIMLLAGDQYAPSIPVLMIIMPAVLFISLTQVTSLEILTPKNCEKTLAVTYALAAGIDIVLNLSLIPQFGALGAAAATSAAETLVFATQLIAIKRRESLAPYLQGCLKILPCSGFAIIWLIAGRLLFGGGFLVAAGVTSSALIVLVVGLYVVQEPLVMDSLAILKRSFSRLTGLIEEACHDVHR